MHGSFINFNECAKEAVIHESYVKYIVKLYQYVFIPINDE